jgi:hypothetical protein
MFEFDVLFISYIKNSSLSTSSSVVRKEREKVNTTMQKSICETRIAGLAA